MISPYISGGSEQTVHASKSPSLDEHLQCFLNPSHIIISVEAAYSQCSLPLHNDRLQRCRYYWAVLIYLTPHPQIKILPRMPKPIILAPEWCRGNTSRSHRLTRGSIPRSGDFFFFCGLGIMRCTKELVSNTN